jgi:hypothetical protein
MREVTAMICRDGGHRAIEAGLDGQPPEAWVAFCVQALIEEREAHDQVERALRYLMEEFRVLVDAHDRIVTAVASIRTPWPGGIGGTTNAEVMARRALGDTPSRR